MSYLVLRKGRNFRLTLRNSQERESERPDKEGYSVFGYIDHPEHGVVELLEEWEYAQQVFSFWMEVPLDVLTS